MSKFHFMFVGPLKFINTLVVQEAQPEVFFWSHPHQTNKEWIIHPVNIYKSAFKSIFKELFNTGHTWDTLSIR